MMNRGKEASKFDSLCEWCAFFYLFIRKKPESVTKLTILVGVIILALIYGKLYRKNLDGKNRKYFFKSN